MRKALTIGLGSLCLLITECEQAGAAPVATAVGGWVLANAGNVLFQIGVGLALAAASAGISYLVSGGGQRQAQAAGDSGSLSSNSGVQDQQRSGLLDRRRLYGRQVTAGGVFFQETVATTGVADRYILGFVISDGICDALESVIINGTEVPVDSFGNPQTAPYYNVAGNKFKVSFRNGADDQAMDPIIASYWPTTPPADFYTDASDRLTRWQNFKQGGVATVVIDMAFGANSSEHTTLWGAGGIPDLQFKLRGLQVYDALNSNADPDDATSWAWTDLATPIEVDWLRTDMGFGVASSEMDWDSIKASTTIDSEWIPTLYGQEQRGRINGVVLGTEANDSVLSSMALQNRALIRRAFGKYNIRADSTRDPVATVYQGLIVGALSYQNEVDTRSAINTAVVEFAPASKFNQSAETTYQDADALAADGEEFDQRLSLRFCDSPSAAQRLGFATIKENRAGRTLTGAYDISCLIAAGKPNGQLLEAGDVERIYFNVYQAMNALYSVTAIEIAQDFTVTLSHAGYDPDTIDGWTVALEQPFEGTT